MGAVHDLIEREFGFPVIVRNPRTVAVATSATQLALADADRVQLIMVNVSVGQGVCLPSNAVAWPEGFLAGANGGTIITVAPEDADLPSLEWYGVQQTAEGNWLVIEVIRGPGG